MGGNNDAIESSLGLEAVIEGEGTVEKSDTITLADAVESDEVEQAVGAPALTEEVEEPTSDIETEVIQSDGGDEMELPVPPEPVVLPETPVSEQTTDALRGGKGDLSEGGIEKTGQAGEPEMPTQSTKKTFDPTTKGDPRKSDGSPDGGVMANTSANQSDIDEGTKFNPTAKKDDDERNNEFELSGFTIQYIPPGEKGIVSEDVRAYYKRKEDAQIAIRGDRYYFMMKGEMVEGKVTRGAPIVCHGERQIMEFVNEKWRR